MLFKSQELYKPKYYDLTKNISKETVELSLSFLILILFPYKTIFISFNNKDTIFC